MDFDPRGAAAPSDQSQHADGTFELTFGGMFLIAAFLFWGIFQMKNLQSSLGTTIFPVIAIAVFLGAGGLLDSLVKKVKKQLAKLRKGIIPVRKADLPSQVGHLAIWLGIPVLTVALMGLLFFNRDNIRLLSQDATSGLLPIFWGGLFSVLTFLVGRKIGLRRLNLVAVMSLAIGGVLFINGADGTIAMVILFGALGTALCISGGITLWQYLRNSGVPSEVL